MLPELEHHFRGLELVDSFDTNPHKWLLTNFDCSTLYLKDATHLKLALTLNPAFLVNKTNEYDYKVSSGMSRSLNESLHAFSI